MTPQTVFFVLCIAASAVAVPDIQQVEVPAVTCGSGSSNVLSNLLRQLINLVIGILDNIASIKLLGLIGKGNLVDLSSLLQQVQTLLQSLTSSGGTAQDVDTPENRDLVSSLIGTLVKTVNGLLGAGTGQNWACNGNGGLLGGLLGNLNTGLLGPILTPITTLVNSILKILN